MKQLWWRLFTGPLAALGVFAVLAGNVLAQEPGHDRMMAEANLRYEHGQYAEAVQQYKALIDLGYRDAAVYYNLGNAYLESDDLGPAILNYLRAEELAARDPDILANLELARSRTVDRLEAEGDSLVASVADFGRRWATLTELGVAALLLWAVGGLAIGALILRPAMQRRVLLRSGAIVALAAMIVPLGLLLSMLYSNPYDNTGVVTAETVEVLSGPGTQFSEEFALHSGAQVRLTGSRHGWLQVALPGGELEGWLPSHAIEAVGRKGGGSSHP